MAALSVALVVGCGPSSAHHGKIITGGGPTTYWNVDLALSRSGKLGAVVVSRPDLQIIANLDSAPTLSTLHPPDDACSQFPVVVAAGSLSGEEEFAVGDPACGLWLADPSVDPAVTRSWADFFENENTDYNLAIEDVDGDGSDDVLIAGGFGFKLCRETVGRECEEYLSPSPGANPGVALRVAVPVHSVFGFQHAILFERDEMPDVVEVQRSQLGAAVSIHQVPTEYLKPFVTFDQLNSASLDGCGIFAVGVGRFDEAAGLQPNRVQTMKAEGSQGFVASTLPTALEDVTALTLVPGDRGELILIGLGTVAGVWNLEAGVLGCDGYRVAAVGPVEFNWRTVAAPAGYTDPSLQHRGIKLLARRGESGIVDAYHYDGFTLRRFKADTVHATITQANAELP